jgi:hypothetical protein
VLRHALMATTAAVALALPATGTAAPARAKLAKANQIEGTVSPNTCGQTHSVFVNGPTRIRGFFAGTNAGGLLVLQYLGPNGAVRADAPTYTTPSAGSYGVRVCFRSDDGIDTDAIQYVGMIVTG